MLPTWYPALVALHLIFMVTFFAGTFYLVRLFVMHRQALALWEPERSILIKQYEKMERTLVYIVAWPSLLLLIGFGLWMTWLQPALLTEPWMQAKLGLTALLVAYHLVDHRVYKKLLHGKPVWRVYVLRLWVQGSVLLMFAIVFLSTYKSVQWYFGILGLALLALLLLFAINAFGKKEPETNAPYDHAGPGKHSA